MKPPKTDPTGRFTHKSCFVTGPETDLLNCGKDLRRMMLQDPAGPGADLTHVPLFRHRATGKEVTKDWFRGWLSRKFAAAGLEQFVGKVHSLRIGGATTLFALHGEAAVRALGGWASVVMYHYLHLTEQRRLEFARDMGRAKDLAFHVGCLPIDRSR